jgi:hypothetical protein
VPGSPSKANEVSRQDPPVMETLSSLLLLAQGQGQLSAHLARFEVQWGFLPVLMEYHDCFSDSNLADC